MGFSFGLIQMILSAIAQIDAPTVIGSAPVFRLDSEAHGRTLFITEEPPGVKPSMAPAFYVRA
jgi:hypothetical protein